MVKVKEKVTGTGNTRIDGVKSDVRIPFTLTEEESVAFDAACAKKFPLATRSAVLRELVAQFVKGAK